MAERVGQVTFSVEGDFEEAQAVIDSLMRGRSYGSFGYWGVDHDDEPDGWTTVCLEVRAIAPYTVQKIAADLEEATDEGFEVYRAEDEPMECAQVLLHSWWVG